MQPFMSYRAGREELGDNTAENNTAVDAAISKKWPSVGGGLRALSQGPSSLVLHLCATIITAYKIATP